MFDYHNIRKWITANEICLSNIYTKDNVGNLKRTLNSLEKF